MLLAIASNRPVLLKTGFVLQGHIYLFPLLSTFSGCECKIPEGFPVVKDVLWFSACFIFFVQPRLSGDLELPDLWLALSVRLTAKHFNFDPNNFIRFKDIKAKLVYPTKLYSTWLWLMRLYRSSLDLRYTGFDSTVCLTGLWEAAGCKRSAGNEGMSL